jgi:hypothetical protein
MNILIMFLGGINNTTAGNAGYGNFTSLVGNLPYGSNTILFSAGFSGTTTLNIGKSGLTIIKMELLKLLKK